ncbi:7933_t:CDS:2, partial [Entrophospora sp. SA101]
MSKKEICTYAQNHINSKQQNIADFFNNKYPCLGIALNCWVEQISASAVVLNEQLIKEKKKISIFQMDGSKSLRKEINWSLINFMVKEQVLPLKRTKKLQEVISKFDP